MCASRKIGRLPALKQQRWQTASQPFLAILFSALALTACSRRDNSGTGAEATSGSGRNAEAQQTTTPKTAPDAQPQYNQTGNGATSRIITNALGQKGLSIRETNGLPPEPGQSQDDQALSQRVRVALSTGTTGTQGTYASESLLDIGVRASNGVVTLTGAVGSESSRQALVKRAQAIEGVRGVINQLQIASTAPSPIPGSPVVRRENESPLGKP